MRLAKEGLELQRGRSTIWWVVSAASALSWCALASAHPGIHHDIERVSASLQKEPGNAELLMERGYYYRLAGQLKESLADLDQAEKLAPSNLDIVGQRGMTLAAIGRGEDAEAELTRFINSGRGSAAVLADRARIRAKSGRADAAIEDYSAALKLGPDVDLYIERCSVQEIEGRLSHAAAGLREGINELGGAIVLRERLVEIEVRRKRYDAALKVIDDQLAVAPVKSEWYLRRGNVLAAAGRDADARADWKRALDEANRVLETRPTATHLISRARANLALGYSQQALSDARLAVQRSPRFAEARALLEQIESKTSGATFSHTGTEGLKNDSR